LSRSAFFESFIFESKAFIPHPSSLALIPAFARFVTFRKHLSLKWRKIGCFGSNSFPAECRITGDIVRTSILMEQPCASAEGFATVESASRIQARGLARPVSSLNPITGAKNYASFLL
jgi:hypothetical protein